jgi:hypothetical protein
MQLIVAEAVDLRVAPIVENKALFRAEKAQPADSDEAGRLFQVKSAMHSNLIAATLPN